MTPLLLLDFDGVLNALLGKGGSPNPDWPDWEKSTADGFTLWTSRTMAAAVSSLAETNWLTTWNEDDKANTLLSPLLDIGPFPVAAAPLTGPERDELWKPRAVAAAIKTGRPVVWLDDDCEFLWDEWLRAAPEWKYEDTSNLFKLAPIDDVGLTIENLGSVRSWLSAIKAD